MASKTWSYTLNNYTEEECELIKDLPCNKHFCGKEVGENNTPHLQGYITFKKATRLSALKKFNNRIHWEISKGDDLDNYLYTLKENIFIKIDNTNQGHRTDLDKLFKDIKDGKKKREIAEEHPSAYLRYHSGIDKMISLNQKKRDFKPYVEWIWGPSGEGKTRYVVEKEKELWLSGKNLRWWQGYENQEATLFDDFRKDFCTFHELLRIIDRYPYTVEIKGGSSELNSKRMYITSCFHPEDVYNTREDIKQLLRRIDKITPMGDAKRVENFVTEVEDDSLNMYL